MIKDNKDRKMPVTAEEVNRWFAPIAIKGTPLGQMLLDPFGQHCHYKAVAAAVESGADSLQLAREVIVAVIAEEQGGLPTSGGSLDWDRDAITNVMTHYMNEPRSRFDAASSSGHAVDEFAAQCHAKLDNYVDFGTQAMASMRRAIVPAADMSALVKRMTVPFASIETPLAKLVMGQAVQLDKMVGSVVAQSMPTQHEWILGLSDSRRALSSALLGIQPTLVALDPFRQQLNQLQESIDKLIERVRERIERDKQLRALGIDAERLRLSGVATWVELVYDVLDTAEDFEEADEAIRELTISGELEAEIAQRLDALPEPTRTLRKTAIAHALDAHRNERYIVSCTVLIAQLDGLVGDILADLLRQQGKRPTRKGDFGDRIKALEDLVDPENEFPSVLASHWGAVSPPDGMEAEKLIKFSRVRHEIMHGHPDAPYTRAQSAKIVFLMLSLLTRLVVLDDGEVQS